MTFSATIIALGEGIGQIQFGMSPDDVEQLLGKPNDTDIQDDDEETIGGTSWHYDELGLSFSFEDGDGMTLTSISATDKKYTVKGHVLLGMTYEDIQELRTELDFGQMEYDNLTEEGGSKQVVIEFNDVGLALWFDDDILSEIQWGPIWSESDGLWTREYESKTSEKYLDFDEDFIAD